MSTSSATIHHTDVLILGAGPAGLYGAYCAGFRGLSTIVSTCCPRSAAR